MNASSATVSFAVLYSICRRRYPSLQRSRHNLNGISSNFAIEAAQVANSFNFAGITILTQENILNIKNNNSS